MTKVNYVQVNYNQSSQKVNNECVIDCRKVRKREQLKRPD